MGTTTLRRRLPLSLILGGALLAACGTTVPLTSSVSGPGAALTSPGGGVGTSSSGPGSSAQGSGAGLTSSGTTASGTSPNQIHPLEGPTGTVSGPGGIPWGGTGVTKTTIEIGLTWIDYRALYALGATNGLSQGKAPQFTGMQEDAQAVVDAVNREGGLAGHKIVPVYYEFPIQDIVNPDNTATDEQAMCAQFTQDHHVFAIMTFVSATGVVNNCAAQHRTFVISTTPSDEAVDKTRFAEIGQWWYAPAQLMINRRDSVYAQSVIRQHFIPRGAKVGLMTLDTPAIRRSVESTLKPALKAGGITIAEEIRYGSGNSTDNWPAYVFKMRSSGITHILWSYGFGDGNTDQFVAAASSQQYRPKMFLSSDLYPAAVAGSSTSTQLAGSRAVGWSPVYDIGASWSNKVWSAGDKRCRKTQDDAGVTNDTQATMFCDTLFFLQAAFRGAPSVSADGLRQGAAALRGNYAFSSTTFGSNFPDARHDGVAYVRDMTFDPSTGAFVYTTQNLNAPQ